MIKCYLVIDDEWHPFWIPWLHGSDVYRKVMTMFEEIEAENIETEAFDPTAPWKSIVVTMVVMGEQPQTWLQYMGTHEQVLHQMRWSQQQWKDLE